MPGFYIGFGNICKVGLETGGADGQDSWILSPDGDSRGRGMGTQMSGLLPHCPHLRPGGVGGGQLDIRVPSHLPPHPRSSSTR